MAKNVYILTLTSGTTVITSALHEDDNKILLKDPLELILDTSRPEVQMFYLIRWMPFSDEHMTLIYKSAVESMTTCSQKFVDIYNRKLTALEASKETIADPDNLEITEAEDSYSEDELDEFEGEEEVEKSGKTYH